MKIIQPNNILAITGLMSNLGNVLLNRNKLEDAKKLFIERLEMIK